MRRIAVALLKEHAHGTQPGVARLEALRALAADGDDSALKLLSGATGEGSAPERRVLASLGNEAAVRVLMSNLEKGGNVPATIEALAESGSPSAIVPLTAR